MGPYANSVQVDVPLSPESDVTSPKDGYKKERGNRVSESEQDPPTKKEQIVKQNHQPKEQVNDVISDVNKYANNQRRHRKGRSGDPRQARSLDLEILEEEAEELKKQLDDEKAKNKYLLTLVEDLKRQIREETGSWYPPPPNSKRIGQPGPYKQSYDGRKSYATEHGMNPNAFKLPQISYLDHKPLQLDHEQQQQPQLQQKTEIADQGSRRRKDGSKLHERNKDLGGPTTLPAIVQSLDGQQRRLDQLKSEEESKIEHPGIDGHAYSSSRGKQHLKGRAKYRHHPGEHPAHFQGNGEQHPHQDPQEQQSNSHLQQQSHKEYRQQKQSQHKNKDDDQVKHQQHEHPQQEQKYSVKQRHQQEQQRSTTKRDQQQSPRRQRSEAGGSSPRTRTVSRGRGSEIDRSSQERNRTGRLISSPAKNSKVNSQVSSAGASVTPESGSSKQSKHRGSKTSQSYHAESSNSYDVAQTNKVSESVMASSSSSIGSLASASSRTKHRGRTNKRGGKKNRKETQEHKEETKDH